LFESLGPIPWFAIKGKGPKSSGSTTGTTWPARLSSALTRRAPYGPGSHVSGPFGLSSKSSFSFCGANPMFQSAESRRCTPKQKWSQLLTVCNVDGGKFKCHELSDIMWIFCKNLIIGRRTPCMLWRRVICCLQLLWSISLITMRYKSSKPLSLYKKNVFVQVLQWNRKRLVSSYLGPGQPNPILNHFFNFNSNSKPEYPIIPTPTSYGLLHWYNCNGYYWRPTWTRVTHDGICARNYPLTSPEK